MRLREVFRFELGHRVRQPSTWLYATLLFAMTLLLAGSSDLAIVTLFNAPVKIATFTLLIGLLGTLITAALFVESGHRDIRSRMESLFHTVPLHKAEYLGGRFLGTLVVNAVLLLVVPLGLLASTSLPSIGPEMLGTLRLEAYVLPYVIFLLPNLLVNAAVMFGITVITRRSLPGYLGAVALVGAYFATLNLSVGVEGAGLSALLDPTGGIALSALTEGWTRAEQDTRLIEPTGLLLWNRLVWIVFGAAMLAFTYRRFQLAHAPAGSGRAARRPGGAVADVQGAERHHVLVVPAARRWFGLRARASQALAVAQIGFRQTVLSRDFLIIAVALFGFFLFMGSESRNDPLFGTLRWPVTRWVVAGLTGSTTSMLVTLLSILYAGELVWRERDARVNELRDTQPVPDWVAFVGNVLALGLMLVVMQAVLMASGMVLQAMLGYYAFQPMVYVQVLFGLQLVDYLLFAVLALIVHVVVNNKYVGHLGAVLVFLATLQAGRFGLEHNLLIYGSDPGWAYSDLSGFGPYIGPLAWFKLYWGSWALLLSVVALLFWVRGTERGLRARMRLARERLTPRALAGVAAAVLLVLSTGGFVFYNTNVAREYRTSWEAEAVEAEYERRYKRFEDAPRPRLISTKLHVELYPDRRRIQVRGSYRLVNRTGTPVDSVHLSSFPYPEVRTRSIAFDRASRPVLEDVRHGYRIHVLERALQPGDSLQMGFEVDLALRGFANSGTGAINTGVVGNGTYLQLLRMLPGVGYQREFHELTSEANRREHGLGPRSFFRSIDDLRARHIPRSAPEADWIEFEGTVGTEPGQTAVLPGTLQRTWTDGDRQYFHYRADAPIINSIQLFSADYTVRTGRWKDVEIRVLHDRDGAVNVDRMLPDIQSALDYYGEQFAPYPHRQFWMVAIPAYHGNFGRAFPGGMMYTETNPIAVARIDDEEAGGVDTPLLITAHEVAHQWWGHLLVAADVQGSQVLSETLAQYSAAMVMKKTRGAPSARRFLRSMHLSYLGDRGSHASPEVPLLLSSDQEYIHYRKGAVAMYALQEYIGEERVNAALRSLLGTHALKGPPYPTTLDLYGELKAVTPDSMQYLLEDLMATITLWDLRATGARAEPLGADEYRVTLEVEAAKVRSDSVGNETSIPMNDLVEIGVFGEAVNGSPGAPLYLGKHRIRSGQQTISVTVSGRPVRAGIDPFHTLISRTREAISTGKVTDVRITGVPDSSARQ